MRHQRARRWSSGLAGIVACLTLAIVPRAATAVVAYDVTPDLGRREVRISMSLPDNGKTGCLLQMPAWTPGDYRIQNHGRFVTGIAATDEAGREVAVKGEISGWRISGEGALTVRYTVKMSPPGLFSENIFFSPAQVFINGTAAFLYDPQRRAEPVRLVAHPPVGWKTYSALGASDPDAGMSDRNAAEFDAPNYDALADAPLLFTAPGASATSKFTYAGADIRLVFYNKAPLPETPRAYAGIVARIVAAESALWGQFPCKRYTYFLEMGGVGGGLEHAESCRVAIPADMDASDAAPFLAHEFFHLWNVKRLRPAALSPIDYQHRAVTGSLWFAEGVTEYYAWLCCRRAGLITPQRLYDHIADQIAALNVNPARHKVTAEEASRKVWDEGESQGYGGLSYYAKGELMGLCMDLAIRQVTDDAKSLDDMMRLLYARYAAPRAGYTDNDLRAALSQIAGRDMGPFYDRLARSREELPLAPCLRYLGLDTQMRAIPDMGRAVTTRRRLWLGL